MYPSWFYRTPNGPFRYNWRSSCVKQSSSRAEAHHLFGSDSEDESPSGDTRSHNTWPRRIPPNWCFSGPIRVSNFGIRLSNVIELKKKKKTLSPNTLSVNRIVQTGEKHHFGFNWQVHDPRDSGYTVILVKAIEESAVVVIQTKDFGYESKTSSSPAVRSSTD